MSSTRIRFEKTECGRCLGSGEYSYNPRDGKRCWGCNGTGQAYTRKGAKAREAVEALRDELTTVPARSITSGDRVLLQGRAGYSTVVEAGVDEKIMMWTGVEKTPVVTVSFRFKNGTGYGMPADGTIRRAPTDAEWQQVLDLASTLPGVELVEVETAQA